MGALVVLAALIAVFAVLNFEEVKVNWIVGSGKAPLIIVILVSLLVGGLITYVAERRTGRRK
jgi:lipopolysaccharide assembly protein A